MIYRFFYIIFSFYYTLLFWLKVIKRKIKPEQEDLIFQRRLDAIKAAIGAEGMNPIHRATLRKLLADLRRL